MQPFVCAVLAGAASCAPAVRAPQSALSAPPSAIVSPGLPPLHITSRGNPGRPVRIVEQAGNREVYELVARSTESSLQSQASFRGTFSQPHVKFFQEDGSTMTADAPSGSIDKATERVVLMGGVSAHTSTGYALRCETLTYDRAAGRLTGEGNVRITSADGSITGGKFTSDLALKHVLVE